MRRRTPRAKRFSKEQAQIYFRAIWSSYLLCSEEKKPAMEEFMAELQMQCVSNGRPGPEWHAFIDTLPGYRAFWTRKKEQDNL